MVVHAYDTVSNVTYDMMVKHVPSMGWGRGRKGEEVGGVEKEGKGEEQRDRRKEERQKL